MHKTSERVLNTISNRIKNMESGRTVVEMLGVLTVIAVLSVGGVWGYKYALNLYRANRIVNGAQDRSLIANVQRKIGQNLNGQKKRIEEDILNYPVAFDASFEYGGSTVKKITISGFSFDVCGHVNGGRGNGLKSIKNWTKLPVLINNVDIDGTPECKDGDVNELVFYVPKPGKPAPRPDPPVVVDTTCNCNGTTIDNGETCEDCGICHSGVMGTTTKTWNDCQKCGLSTNYKIVDNNGISCGTCSICEGGSCVDKNITSTYSILNANKCCVEQTTTYCSLTGSAPSFGSCTANPDGCNQCNTDGTLTDRTQTVSIKELDGNCCVSRNRTYCPIKGELAPVGTCTADNTTTSTTDGVCTVTTTIKNTCTNTTISSSTSNKSDGTSVDTCHECQSGVSVHKTNGSNKQSDGKCCVDGELKYDATYCPMACTYKGVTYASGATVETCGKCVNGTITTDSSKVTDCHTCNTNTWKLDNVTSNTKDSSGQCCVAGVRKYDATLCPQSCTYGGTTYNDGDTINECGICRNGTVVADPTKEEDCHECKTSDWTIDKITSNATNGEGKCCVNGLRTFSATYCPEPCSFSGASYTDGSSISECGKCSNGTVITDTSKVTDCHTCNTSTWTLESTTSSETNDEGKCCVAGERKHDATYCPVCPKGTTWDGVGKIEEALETGHCICSSWTENVCGTGYYCDFSDRGCNCINNSIEYQCGTGYSCTNPPPESKCIDGHPDGSGVCKNVDIIGSEVANGHIYGKSPMNQWTANSWCLGKVGKNLIDENLLQERNGIVVGDVFVNANILYNYFCGDSTVKTCLPAGWAFWVINNHPSHACYARNLFADYSVNSLAHGIFYRVHGGNDMKSHTYHIRNGYYYYAICEK